MDVMDEILDHLRHHRGHEHMHGMGDDFFGRWSERIAVFLGTPAFLIGQTIVTIVWIAFNMVMLAAARFDPYPFILLNLAYSIQSGFAAPFILCAQTRQAARDKAQEEADAKHREELAQLTYAKLDALLSLARSGAPASPTPDASAAHAGSVGSGAAHSN